MEALIEQMLILEVLNQIGLALVLLIPLMLIARAVVKGTTYSPILVIVIIGLSIGYIFFKAGIFEPGLPGFPIITLISGSVIVVLTGVFFSGGQELRKLFGKVEIDENQTIIPSDEEVVLGTKRTQLFEIIRVFFLLIGISALTRQALGNTSSSMSQFYPLITYIGLSGGILFVGFKDKIANKSRYIWKGALEIVGIVAILILTFHVSSWVQSIIALPQIFFVMVFSLTAGWFLYKWTFGPTVRAMLFAGVPMALAGVFLVGGSRIAEAFGIVGMSTVIAYGFFGQLLWMFGGIAILMYFGKTYQVRSLGPGMAGSLSHAGLTGACTAGDLGLIAAKRAPIMINVPFFGHIILFPILAMSIARGELMLFPRF